MSRIHNIHMHGNHAFTHTHTQGSSCFFYFLSFLHGNKHISEDLKHSLLYFISHNRGSTKAYRGSRGVVPLSFNFNTRCMWVVNLTAPLLYTRGYTDAQSWSWGLGEEKNLLPPPGCFFALYLHCLTLQSIPIVPTSHKSTVSSFPWDTHCTVSHLWARDSGSPYTTPNIPVLLQLRGMNFPILRTNWPMGAFMLSASLSHFLHLSGPTGCHTLIVWISSQILPHFRSQDTPIPENTYRTLHFSAYISEEKRMYISPHHQWDLSPLGLLPTI
jgi:hypothetical protein